LGECEQADFVDQWESFIFNKQRPKTRQSKAKKPKQDKTANRGNEAEVGLSETNSPKENSSHPEFEADTCKKKTEPHKKRVSYRPNKKSKTLQTQTKADSKDQSKDVVGPQSDAYIKKMIRALIHSPQPIQIMTSENCHFSPIQIRDDLSIAGLSVAVDKVALELVTYERADFADEDLKYIAPKYDPGMYPSNILGDGNCLPRCGSLLAYGSQNYHAEIRLRIAIELILYEDLYTDDDYLSRGLKGQKLTAAAVAQMSDFFVQQKLTPTVVKRIYHREINQILKMNKYMGVWQLFAMSSVLQMRIQSMYPQLGTAAINRDLNRMILPRQQETNEIGYILWSSTRADMKEEYWNPNHFVVFLPLSNAGRQIHADYDSEETLEGEHEVPSIDEVLLAIEDPLALSDVIRTEITDVTQEETTDVPHPETTYIR